MRNTFLEKPYTKCGRETILRHFIKNQNSKVLYSLFLLYAKLKTIEIN